MNISQRLFEQAQHLIPGGVNSPVRAWRAMDMSPRFIGKAQGSKIIDVDGNVYLDFVGSWGPMITGHAHPEVVEAIREAVAAGTSYGAPTKAEVELAELLVAGCPKPRNDSPGKFRDGSHHDCHPLGPGCDRP